MVLPSQHHVLSKICPANPIPFYSETADPGDSEEFPPFSPGFPPVNNCRCNARSMVLYTKFVYAYNMYQKMYSKMKLGRLLLPGTLVMCLSACQSFGPGYGGHCHGDDCTGGGHAFDHDHNHDHAYNATHINAEGLIVGAVMNAGTEELKDYQRWRYADRLASNILDVNPQLSGNIDSYQYLSKRIGKKPLKSLLESYRLNGEFSGSALDALKTAQLRRRYLMMARLSSYEESLPLKPDNEPVVGPYNREVHDYYDYNRQTVLRTAVMVQVYDTYTGSKIHEEIITSHDGGHMLATQNSAKQYVGNSVAAAITNTIANGLTGSSAAYPAPPSKDAVLDLIWRRVATKLPGEIFTAAR